MIEWKDVNKELPEKDCEVLVKITHLKDECDERKLIVSGSYLKFFEKFYINTLEDYQNEDNLPMKEFEFEDEESGFTDLNEFTLTHWALNKPEQQG